MTLPTRLQALSLYENIFILRKSSVRPFFGDQEQTLRAHSLAVAGIAEKIASVSPNMDKDKAYILGLLHDCGRIKDEKTENCFHGYVGFQYMMSINQPEIARISLTHTFYEKDFDASTYPQNSEQLEKCRSYLQEIEYNDYDLLIQLADILNDMGKICTIETRFSSIVRRYGLNPEVVKPHIRRLHEIKEHFDKKAGCDIYCLLGIK